MDFGPTDQKSGYFSHVLQPTCVKIRGRLDNFLPTKYTTCKFLRQFPKYLVIFAWRRWRESGNIHLAIKRRGRWVLDGKTATELCSVKVTRWPIDLQRMWAKSSRTQQVSRNKKCKHSQWSIPMFEHGQMVGTIHIEKHTVKVYRGHMGSCLNHAEIGRSLPVSSDLLSFPNSMVSKCFDTKKLPWIYTQWCWYIVVGFSSQKKRKKNFQQSLQQSTKKKTHQFNKSPFAKNLTPNSPSHRLPPLVMMLVRFCLVSSRWSWLFRIYTHGFCNVTGTWSKPACFWGSSCYVIFSGVEDPFSVKKTWQRNEWTRFEKFHRGG